MQFLPHSTALSTPSLSTHRLVRASFVAFLAIGFALTATPAVEAQVASVVVSSLPCLPVEGNAAVHASVSPPTAAATVRTFFRRQDYGDMYYLTMNSLGGGNYWAVLPKPERQNEVVEYHVTALDAAGAVLNSSPIQRTTVLRDCEAKLAQAEEQLSEALTIGETTKHQKGHPVAWFLCDGILHRVDTQGEVRVDEFCSVPPTPIPIVDRGGLAMQGGPTVTQFGTTSPSTP